MGVAAAIRELKSGVVTEISTFLLAAMLAVTPVSARQVTGELGSPSPTTTIDGKQIPAPHLLHSAE